VVAVHRDVGKQLLEDGRAEIPARSLTDMRRSFEKVSRKRGVKQSKEARNLQAALDAAEAPSAGAGVSPRKKSVKKRVQNPRT
jgi:primase-polymerase (primpol)-like protein